MENNMIKVKLSKKALFRCWANWSLWSHTCYNWVRMQGIGFAHCMVSITKELYKDRPEERAEAMKRHTEFFNTEPEIGIICHGLAVAMEEQKANGEEVSGELITSVKTSLMGPLAGVGDTLFQGVIVPMVLAIFIDLTLNGLTSAPIIYAIVITAISVGISYPLFMYSYNRGRVAVMKLIEGGLLNKVLSTVNILGCVVMGALIASYVNVNSGISFTASGVEFNLQTQLFDAILPKLLPLGVTFLCYQMLKKGYSAVKIILILVVIGVIGNFTGILA